MKSENVDHNSSKAMFSVFLKGPTYDRIDLLWFTCNNYSELSILSKDIFLKNIEVAHKSWNPMEKYWFIRLSKNIIPFLSEKQRNKYSNTILKMYNSERNTKIVNEVFEVFLLIYRYAEKKKEKKEVVEWLLENLQNIHDEENLIHLAETVEHLFNELTLKEKEVISNVLLDYIHKDDGDIDKITKDYVRYTYRMLKQSP